MGGSQETGALEGEAGRRQVGGEVCAVGLGESVLPLGSAHLCAPIPYPRVKKPLKGHFPGAGVSEPTQT